MVLVSVIEQIQADLKTAMIERQEPKRTVLRSLVAAVKNAEIATGATLSEEEVVRVVSKELKQREEAAAAATERPEMAAQETAEAEVIRAYLPQPLSEEELTSLIDAAITETGAATQSDIGKVMGQLKGKIAGRADGGHVAALVKSKLG